MWLGGQVFPKTPVESADIDHQVEIDAHYLGYLSRQARDIKSFLKDENVKIPKNINYDKMGGLSNEIQ